MTNTIKKVTLTTLGTLALAGTFTVAHTPTVLAESHSSVTQVNQTKDAKQLIQKIKDSKESIKKNIEKKLNNSDLDFQKISERFYGNDIEAVSSANAYIEVLDLNFVVNTNGLSKLDFQQSAELLKDDKLEERLTGDKSHHLAELSDYYKAFELYFAINEKTTPLKVFEDYVFNSKEAKEAESKNENRFTYLLNALK